MIAECCWECDDKERVQLFQLPRNFPAVLGMMFYSSSADVPCMYCKQSDWEEWIGSHQPGLRAAEIECPCCGYIFDRYLGNVKTDG